MYSWFRSQISLRGIAALAIGCMFIVLALAPEAFGDSEPPWIIKALMLVAGVVMVAGGFLAVRFKKHRQHVVASTVARDVLVELEDGGGEGSSDTVYVETEGGRWAVPFDGPAAAWRSFNGGKGSKGGKGVKTDQMAGRAWFDPATDTPLAVEVNGVLLNTLAEPRRLD